MFRPPPTPMLQAFVASAKRGSFVKASTELNLTASAVSHQIRNLEEWWRVTLFKRHARGVTLTREGQELLPLVNRFFEELEQTLGRLPSAKPDPLVLACTSSLCQNWLGSRLMHYARDFDIALQATEVTVANVQDQKFDLAITVLDHCPKGFQSQLLMRDTVFPVCAPSLLKDKKVLPSEEITAFTIIERAVDGICPAWRDWWEFEQLTQAPEAQGTKFHDTSMTLNLATQGKGIALGRMALVYDQLCEGSLATLVDHAMPSPSPYRLLWKKEAENRDLQALIEWLSSEAKNFITETENRFPGLGVLPA